MEELLSLRQRCHNPQAVDLDMLRRVLEAQQQPSARRMPENELIKTFAETAEGGAKGQ
jgi:hypothetical protein